MFGSHPECLKLAPLTDNDPGDVTLSSAWLGSSNRSTIAGWSSRHVSLLADGAVDELPDDVEVPGMAGAILNEIGTGCFRAFRRLDQSHRRAATGRCRGGCATVPGRRSGAGSCWWSSRSPARWRVGCCDRSRVDRTGRSGRHPGESTGPTPLGTLKATPHLSVSRPALRPFFSQPVRRQGTGVSGRWRAGTGRAVGRRRFRGRRAAPVVVSGVWWWGLGW